MDVSSSGWIIAAAAAAAAGIFVLDVFIPLGIAVPMLYVIPVLLTWLVPGPRITAVLVSGSIALTVLGVVFSPGEFTPAVAADRVLASALQLVVAALLLIHKESVQRLATAQQAMEKSEERLRLAQSAEGFGTFDWDIPGQTVVWSPETERIWGLPVGGYEGTYEHWRRMVHPDDVAEAERMAQRSLESPDVPYAYDHRIVRPDGTIRWIHAKATTVRDAAGRPIRMVGVNSDITERKRVEEQLRLGEERLRLALEGADLGSWDVDVRTGEAQWNRRHAVMQGYEPGSGPVSIQKWKDRVHPDDLDRIMAAVERAKLQRGLFAEEHRVVLPDNGMERWLSLYGRFVYDDTGAPVRFSGVSLDITERKWAEALLTGQNHVLESIVEGAPLEKVLTALMHVLESQLPGMLCSVLLRDVTGTRLRYGAAPSLPADYNSAIDGISIGSDVGSCGTAAFRGKLVVVEDIATDPLWASFRSLALVHELRACWSMPILDDKHGVLGTFAIYSRRPGRPTGEHMRIANVATRIAAIAIMRHRTEEALRQLNETLEQRVAERTTALQEAEERFRRIFQYAAEGIAVTDLEGRFVQCNAAYAAIVGYTEPELRAMDFQSLIHPDDRPQNLELVRQMMSGAVPSFEVENRYLTKAGCLVWVHKHASILRNDRGVPTHLLVLVTNITQRKRDEEVLRQQRARLEDLASQLLTAQDDERRRIARELHDDHVQRLAALALDLHKLARSPLKPVEQAKAAITQSARSVRRLTIALQQVTHQLHPSTLTHLGLEATLRDYVEEFAQRLI